MKQQTTKPKIWKRNGHLTKKAKSYLSYKVKQFWESPEGQFQKKIRKQQRAERKLDAQEQKLMQEFTYSVKMIYESPRDSHHDVITECNVTIVSDKEPSQTQIQDYVANNIDEFTEFGVPYTEAVVGLVSSEATNQSSETMKIKNVEYSHNLGRSRSTKAWNIKRRTLK